MKKLMLMTGTVLIALGGLTAAHADTTTVWFVPGPVDLRSGPDESFPIVASIPSKEHMELEGCLQNWTWCDISWNGQRGWVSGHAIEAIYQNKTSYVADIASTANVPVITYNTGTYWDTHYRTAPFYTQREHYIHWTPALSSSSASTP
jgi:uncharacterized protein YraI